MAKPSRQIKLENKIKKKNIFQDSFTFQEKTSNDQILEFAFIILKSIYIQSSFHQNNFLKISSNIYKFSLTVINTTFFRCWRFDLLPCSCCAIKKKNLKTIVWTIFTIYWKKPNFNTHWHDNILMWKRIYNSK